MQSTIIVTVMVLLSTVSCAPASLGVQKNKLLQLNNCAQICRYPAMECEYVCQGDGRCEADCSRELALCVRKCYTDLLTEIEQLSLIDPQLQYQYDEME
ncbi:hypothetical protein FBUS_06407 [Fasciolopsis buskii]|uniref:Uncharacterized protein n=1 Tax=Fasciolopsis buskii TaxID=27845 RepID=A0A8E0S0N8_9TREM|nr:hypothetical protein FBUS_06407 [Fasciolopsis buski]